MSAGNGRDLEKRYDQTDNAKKEPKKNKVDDEATGLEKILTGLGVAAAIVIVSGCDRVCPEAWRSVRKQHSGGSDKSSF